MLIVADTGPLQYLSLTGCIDLLPALYREIAIPRAVAEELSHSHTPVAVRAWISKPPLWLHIYPDRQSEMRWPDLDNGEREALSLALDLHADLILLDDSAERSAALTASLRVIGTISVLYQAARERHFLGATNMASAFDQAISSLRSTNFFFTDKLDAAIDGLSVLLHQQELDYSS